MYCLLCVHRMSCRRRYNVCEIVLSYLYYSQYMVLLMCLCTNTFSTFTVFWEKLMSNLRYFEVHVVKSAHRHITRAHFYHPRSKWL